MNKPILLLSLNGGGMRGVFTARILSHVETFYKKQCYELFDIIVGNSTGAILGTALGKGLYAKQAVDLYVKRGKDIFAKKSLWNRIKGLNGILDEKYELANLVGVIKEYMGETTLAQHKTKVMTVTYDLVAGRPFFMKSWHDDHCNIPMWVAAVASGDAPTYFEPLDYANYLFVDGGTMAVNNPTISLLAEAIKLGYKQEDIKVLNLGTGLYQEKVDIKKTKNWGILRAVKPVIDIALDGSAQSVVYQSEQILGKNYLNVDVYLPKELAPMDKWQNCPDLVKIADRVWEQRGKEILEFLFK
jgi:patatin-like phospholipase/acyl hydrolase